MIRAIDYDEIDKILPIVFADAKAVGIDTRRINVPKLKLMLIKCIETAAILVSERDGVITGIMSLFASESYWCDDVLINNLVYFVLPEHRNSRDGIELLKEAQRLCNNAGLQFDFHIQSYEDNDRKDRVFQRLGFKKLGASYKYGGK